MVYMPHRYDLTVPRADSWLRVECLRCGTAQHPRTGYNKPISALRSTVALTCNSCGHPTCVYSADVSEARNPGETHT